MNISLQWISSQDYLDIKRLPYNKTVGISYYDRELGSQIICADHINNIWTYPNGQWAVNSQRPNKNTLQKGFKFYDRTINSIIVFDGAGWQELQSFSIIPLTVNVESDLPNLTGYTNNCIYSIDKKRPLWYDDYFRIWRDSQGIEIGHTYGDGSNIPTGTLIGTSYFNTQNGIPYFKKQEDIWVDGLGNQLGVTHSSTTTNRPTDRVKDGFYFYDTEIKQPIWRDTTSNTGWRNANGEEV